MQIRPAPAQADASGRTPRPYRRSDAARRVTDLLRLAIVSGAYAGGPLPMESALMATYMVSRNTVRESLDLLREEGLVERRQGAGTFSLSQKASHPLDRLHSVADSFSSRDPSTIRLMDVVIYPAVALVAEKLGVPPGTPTVFMERLTIVRGDPVMLRSSWLPADLAGPLLEMDLENRDFYDLLEVDLGLEVDTAELMLEAVSAGVSVAPLLGVPVGSAILLFDRLTRLANGRVIEFGFSRARGDMIVLVSEVSRNADRRVS